MACKFLPLVMAAGLFVGTQTGTQAQNPPVNNQWFVPGSFWRTTCITDTPAADQGDATKIYNQWRYDVYGNDKSVTNPNWRSTFSMPSAVWTVPAGQSTINVGGGVAGWSFANAVPFPSNWVQSNFNTDHHTVIWQPTANGGTGTMWEFWNCVGTYPGITGGWGGKIVGVTTSDGIMPAGFGARATGLPNVGGIVTRYEAQQIGLNPSSSGNLIPHVLAVVLPQIAGSHTVDVFVAPANRQDDYPDGGPNAIPEGRRFRLPANVTVPASPPLLRAIVIAARDYGMVVVDGMGSGNMIGLQGELNKPGDTDYWRVTMNQPAEPTPWSPSWTYQTYNVLDAFPWNQLQVLNPPGSSTLLDDAFNDAGVTNGADALDTGWAALANASVGVGAFAASGNTTNALAVNSTAAFSLVKGGAFTSRALADGDSVVLSYDFRVTTLQSNSSGLRVALGSGSNTYGICIGTGTTAGAGCAVWPANLISGANTALTTTGTPIAINDTNPHTMELSLTRSGSTLLLRVYVDGGYSYTATATGVSNFTFDRVILGTGSTANLDFNVDNADVVVSSTP